MAGSDRIDCRTLVAGPAEAGYVQFMAREGIQHVEIHIPANKGQVRVGPVQIIKALKVILDSANYPLLVHCNKGKVDGPTLRVCAMC